MIILLLGAPGSGKGTQAKKLCKALGLSFFSSGDIARELAKKDEKIAEIMNKKGQWIPEEEMTKHVFKHLEEDYSDYKNILFEGYPRFVSQYQGLKDWLRRKGVMINKVVVLTVSLEEAVKRLSMRRIDSKTGEIYNLLTNPPGSGVNKDNLIQRKDDKEDVIKNRFEQYKIHTEPIRQIAKKDGILIEIDGERPIEVIHKDILSRIKNK